MGDGGRSDAWGVETIEGSQGNIVLVCVLLELDETSSIAMSCLPVIPVQLIGDDDIIVSIDMLEESLGYRL